MNFRYVSDHPQEVWSHIQRLEQENLRLREVIADINVRSAIAITNPLFPSRDVSPNVLDHPVDTLELTTRARKCLDLAGARTIRDLVRLTDEYLLKEVRNFGTTTSREVRRKLLCLGLHLGMSEEQITAWVPPQ